MDSDYFDCSVEQGDAARRINDDGKNKKCTECHGIFLLADLND